MESGPRHCCKKIASGSLTILRKSHCHTTMLAVACKRLPPRFACLLPTDISQSYRVMSVSSVACTRRQVEFVPRVLGIIIGSLKHLVDEDASVHSPGPHLSHSLPRNSKYTCCLAIIPSVRTYNSPQFEHSIYCVQNRMPLFESARNVRTS